MQRSGYLLTWLSAGAALCLAACVYAVAGLASNPPTTAGVASPVQPTPGCTAPLPVSGLLPFDTSEGTTTAVNCFAWQSFIALNWPADPDYRGRPSLTSQPDQFGLPQDTTPGVWQTYKSRHDVFREAAAHPTDWQDADIIPAQCQSIRGAQSHSVMRLTSKLTIPLTDDLQAVINQPLVDQANHVVYYEQRMNEEMFQYTVAKQLYDADVQTTEALTNGIRFPASFPSSTSTPGLDVSIEIKAAWRNLDGQPSKVINRYKTTAAIVQDPQTDSCRETLMGLVGLHIVRKTQAMPQWMWATFEHVDNVPSDSEHPDPRVTYSFYNPACLPAPCPTNVPPSGVSGPFAFVTPHPVQVERIATLQPEIEALNQYAQDRIKATNSSSVWQYYRLINVRWPQESYPNEPVMGATVPILLARYRFLATGESSQTPTPGLTVAVSNVSMETYMQTIDCAVCHARSAVAPSRLATCGPTLVVRHGSTDG